MPQLKPTTRREAHQRYDADLPIGITNTRYPDGLTGATVTRAATGWTFAELCARSIDSRRPSALYFFTPEAIDPAFRPSTIEAMKG